ncbi:TonB-dependent receptor plug [Sphingobium chlorophenolicum L-1]|uniref:TonB-dependent receptor plug n=1 Tax=Sphingobium chlorophenolicum L-1 TaxID=690566 RepID=F6EWW9_SPHCR|nr:TonB-dependent receptor [Sphingobium chlorophenolicum]AEG48132.1 TonB-dependent receptor plug [Sphingobium chlorophenolicum L-1]
MRNRSVQWFATVAVIATSTAFTAAHAQSAGVDAQTTADQASSVTDASAGGDIVVTAQRRQESLQKVGISVTAFDESRLQNLGALNSSDIVAHTPNMQLFQFSPTATVYNLRGVSQNSIADHLEAPIAVYMNDAYVSAMGALSTPIYDLERVEVLRGPQGTLYGRNTTGGLINYISKEPGDSFDAYLQGTYGSYNLLDIKGAVGGPIVSDTVMGRFSFAQQHQDGYMQSRVPGVRDAQGQNLSSVRGQLLIKPSSRFSLLGSLTYTKDRNVPTGAYVYSAATQDPRTGLGVPVGRDLDPFGFSSDRVGFFEREYVSGTVRAKWQASDAFELTSITNYQHLSKAYGEDADATTRPAFNYDTNQRLKQFSEELRLAGEVGRLKWQAGAYYLNIDTDVSTAATGFIAQYTNSATGMLSDRATSNYSVKTESWSLFAQGDYELTDTLKLTVGGRYTHDVKRINMFSRYQQADGTVLLAQSDVPGLGIAPICYAPQADARCPGDVADPDARQTLSDWAGKVQIDWTPQSGTLLYASVSRGIKGGSWSTPLFADSIALNGLASLRHGKETLYAYEVGAKLSLAPRMRLNGAVFYYDYPDYQAFSLVNFVQSVTNNDATIKGAELEFNWSPVRDLTLNLNAAWLDTKVRGILTPNGIRVDTRMPQAPKVSLNGLIRYEFEGVGDGRFFVQGDAVYNAVQYLEVTNAAVDREPAYAVANARVGWTSGDGKHEIAFWVKNVTNNAHRIYALDLSGAPRPFVESVYAPPRTFGGTITAHF